ncbi:MAG: zinc ribbon domain-containing protein [Solirubrobacterales bacterium]|nr:zinc ribbon domain-containing protein [Solirubrobacterales bacterium]
MPLYDFRCRACGAGFEARTPAEGRAACPECGSENTERLLSPFAGPFTVAPRGAAARRSNDQRRVREEQRAERKEERRRRRAEPGGGGPGAT